MLLILLIAVTMSAESQSATIITAVPTDTVMVPAGVEWQRLITIEKELFDGPFTRSAKVFGNTPSGHFTIDNGPRGLFRFAPAWGDTGKVFRFEVAVVSAYLDTVSEVFSVLVRDVAPPVIQIEVCRGWLHSGIEEVSLFKSGGELRTGAMMLTIAYLPGAITFDSISVSDSIRALGWELRHYTRRESYYGVFNSLVNLVTIVGQNLSELPRQLPNGKLFDLCFTSSGAKEYDGRFDPIVFAWANCRDNTFQSEDLDTIYFARDVESYDRWAKRESTKVNLDKSCSKGWAVYTEGPCEECFKSSNTRVKVPQIIFRAGGIDRVCCEYFSESGGDMNENDIPFEIADMLLYSAYLLKSDVWLDTSSASYKRQRGDSDVNQDGLAFTVADLVYLHRVIVGDALPYPRLEPYSNVVSLTEHGDTLSINATTELGAVLLKYDNGEGSKPENLSGLQMDEFHDGSKLTVLLHAPQDSLLIRIPAGINHILKVGGTARLVSIEISDYQGNMLLTHREQ